MKHVKLWLTTVAVLLCSITKMSGEVILTEADGLLNGISVNKAGKLQYEYTSPKFTVDKATNTLTFTFLEGYTRTSSLNDKNGYPFVAFSEFYLYDGEGNEITLNASNFSTNAQEPTEGPIANICDKNRTTFFHSLWSAGASDYHNLVITLPEGMELKEFRFKYHTRWTSHGIPKKLSVKASNGEISIAQPWEENTDGIILSQANGPLGTLQGSTSGNGIRYYKYTSPVQTLNEATNTLMFTFLEGYTVDGSLNDKNGFPFVAFSEFCLYDGEGNEIALDASNFSTNAQEPTEGPISNICDKDYNTHFHSMWSTGASDYHNITITLPEGVKLKDFYFQYNTRWVTDNWNLHGLPKTISIKAGKEVIANGTCGENLTWVLTVDGNLTISGSGEMYDYNYDAPWRDYSASIKKVTIDEGVSTIGCSAFAYCENLASANIPNGVTRIGWDAFWNTNISSVYIPQSVREIWNAAFGDCDNLVSIVVDEENPVYDSRNNCNAIIETETTMLISGCATTIIPNGIDVIANFAFIDCDNLVSIDIPESMEIIAYRAFWNCRGLESLIIPKNVHGIHAEAFGYCYSLRTISVDSENPNYDSRNNCNAIIETGTSTIIRGTDQTVIPENVKAIGDFAFSGCIPMNSFNIPEGVTSIGSYAFCQCNNLTSISLPESIVSIGEYAFYNCYNLKSIELPYSVTEIEDYTFAYCQNLSSVSFPEGLAAIGNSAFYNCSSIKTVTMPNSVERVGREAFHYCYNLESLSISESLDTISPLTFGRSDKLKKITIPNSVSVIGEGAFWGCPYVTTLVIGENVKTIMPQAFNQCLALSQIDSYAAIPPMAGIRAFYKVNTSTCRLNVPVGSKAAYQTAEIWKDFSLVFEKEELTSIEQLSISNVLIWPTNIYDMNGHLVRKNAHSADGLDNGIYIINGRKVVIQ